jgi:hypothetical protein
MISDSIIHILDELNTITKNPDVQVKLNNNLIDPIRIYVLKILTPYIIQLFLVFFIIIALLLYIIMILHKY